MQLHFPFPILVFEFEVLARIRSGNPEGSVSSTMREISFRLSGILLLVKYFYPNALTQKDIQTQSLYAEKKNGY